MSRYSKFKIGDNATIIHEITNEDIEKFVSLSGDNNKLHLDSEFASKTSFKRPVVHGMIGASFISTLIGTKIPGDGALWYSQNIDFLLPVRIGDILTIKAEITKMIPRLNSIELKTEIINQNKQIVTKGIAKVKIIEDDIQPKTKEKKKSNKKVVLILGSTGGIGSETARIFAQKGYELILHYNKNHEKAIQLKNQLSAIHKQKIIIVKANILDQKDIICMFEEIKRNFAHITGLVNTTILNFSNIKFSRIDWNDISKQIEINIKSSFYIMKNVIPLMEKDNYGKIVFLTTQSTEQFVPEWLHYTTAKSALNGFAKTLAIELAPIGIRVNLVSPGMTDTNLITDIPEKVKLVTAAKTPLKRIAKPIDIAEAIAYLISSKSDFLTGETLRVNGGQNML